MSLALLLFALVTSSAPNQKTAWMTPQSFHLTVGMTRADAVKTLLDAGCVVKPGKDDDEMIVDYTEDKAMTLGFNRNRLRSIRFELFAQLADVRAAFAEQKSALKKEHGEPKPLASESVVVYDDRLPNIVVVLSDDPKSEMGKQGFGYLAVRYFDPVWRR